MPCTSGCAQDLRQLCWSSQQHPPQRGLVNPDNEAQRQRAQRVALERLQRQQTPDVRLPTPAVAESVERARIPVETPCFRIQAVQLDGARLHAFDWLLARMNRYLRECVGREGLNLIVRQLSAQLIERGLITTRIGIPEQDLSSGVLRLQVFPGVIREIRFKDDSARASWRSALPMRPGDLLDLRDLEQGLEQMKRLPSQDVDFKIVPADTPGQSDIVIEVKQQKPWRIAASLDNAGSRSTGYRQAALSVSFDNPLGMNDLLSLTWNRDADQTTDQHGTRGSSIAYSVPWGY